MARIPDRSSQGKREAAPAFNPLHVERLVLYLHGLAIQGADDQELYRQAYSWCDRNRLVLAPPDVETIVHAVLERVANAAPAVALRVPESPPSQGGDTGFSDTQDSQDTQGFSKGSAAKDAAKHALTDPSEKPIPPEEAAREAPQPDPSQPLAEYLVRAAWQVVNNPADNWQSELWAFTRWCKGHPDLTRRTARKAFDLVSAALKKLRSQAPFDEHSPCCPWSRWTGMCKDGAEEEFFGCWDRIRFLPGHTPLESAAQQATACPLKLLDRHFEDRPPGYVRLISLAGWLQVSVGALPILLPSRDVARFLQCSPQAVSRYLRWALQDELLIKVAPHTFHPKSKTNKAASYRFAVDRFPVLREKLPEVQGPEEAARGSEPREES